MSLILGLALAAALASKQDCSWDRPGLHPFMGDVAGAVDRYKDIAPEVRARLKERMQKRQYDDIASIRRDSIEGKFSYEPTLRQMHFGNGSVCTQVSRKKWTNAAQERGLVYCEKNQCIIVPTVCRNVSRITRRDGAGPENSAGVNALLPAVVVIDVPVPPLPPEQAGSFMPVSSGTNPAPDFSGGRAFSSSAGAETTFAGIGAARIAPDVLGGVATPNPLADPVVPSSPVPEPGTWAMLLAGLGLLAALRRRGRTARLGAPA